MGSEHATTTGRNQRIATGPQPPDHEVVVVGAGPGGIAAGVKLKRAGIEDFAILERAARIGGSWRDNTYPGICVDIPSITYQYSFARNPRWSRVFADGEEVMAYHEEVAERFGLGPHIEFGADVTRELWDGDAQLWRLYTAAGDVITTRFLISAIGAFINAKQDPGIPGLDEFVGKLQRPSSWDHEYDHAGKRVAVIGTGASSVQITPSIAPEVALLEVYQRTPVWCLPKPNPPVPRSVQGLLAMPGVSKLVNGLALAGVDLGLRAIVYAPPPLAARAIRAADAAARAAYGRYVASVIDDPELKAALTPSYGPGVKRPTASNDYLRAFNRPNVRLITTPIERFAERGVQTTDGAEHELDMVVLATGYELFSDPESYKRGTVVGRDGFDLGAFYAEHGLQAYESVAVPGLPNRWTLVGPYSWTGTGWHALVEIGADHAVRAITEARRRRAAEVEVRLDAHDAYHARVLKYSRNIRYYLNELNGDTRTYYRNSQGDSTYIRPSSYLEALRGSRRFPLEDYRFVAPLTRADGRRSVNAATIAAA